MELRIIRPRMKKKIKLVGLDATVRSNSYAGLVKKMRTAQFHPEPSNRQYMRNVSARIEDAMREQVNHQHYDEREFLFRLQDLGIIEIVRPGS